jgi:hypothetical protein
MTLSKLAGATALEPATSCVTAVYSVGISGVEKQQPILQFILLTSSD